MADTANLGLGTGNPFLGKDNPYLQSIIDLSSKDLTDNYNRTALPASNAAMVRSGSFGNSGLQEMQRADADQLQGNLGDLASKLRFNDYTQQQGMFQWQKGFDENSRQYEQNFDRGVWNDAYGQNMGNLQAGMGLIDWMSGRNQLDIGNTTQQQNAPLDYWQQFLQQANSVGQGYGTSTGTQGTTSNPLGTALGGAQLGSSWWNSRNGGNQNSQADASNADSWFASNDSGGWGGNWAGTTA